MSRQNNESTGDGYGYQKKSNEEVDGIVKRLNTPKKVYEPKEPERRKKLERRMTAEDISSMVERLSSAKKTERRHSAYEQGGVFLSYECTGWEHPGSGGKRYDF